MAKVKHEYKECLTRLLYQAFYLHDGDDDYMDIIREICEETGCKDLHDNVLEVKRDNDKKPTIKDNDETDRDEQGKEKI